MSSREPCEDCGLLQDHMDGCPQLNAYPDYSHSWPGGLTYEQYQFAEPWGAPEELECERYSNSVHSML